MNHSTASEFETLVNCARMNMDENPSMLTKCFWYGRLFECHCNMSINESHKVSDEAYDFYDELAETVEDAGFNW